MFSARPGVALHQGEMLGDGGRSPNLISYALAVEATMRHHLIIKHEDFRNDLGRIDVPTMVIHGDTDRIVPIAASGHRTAKMIKGARLLVVKDGPHCITWTHAEQVNDGLLEFLGKVKRSTRAA